MVEVGVAIMQPDDTKEQLNSHKTQLTDSQSVIIICIMLFNSQLKAVVLFRTTALLIGRLKYLPVATGLKPKRLYWKYHRCFVNQY
jgi:hypothetical protein